MTYVLVQCFALLLGVVTWYPVGSAIREWNDDQT